MVYGILSRQWSLRELEALARRDVGAWWICGGHQPDHSTIGKFIQLHAEILNGEFFVALVKTLTGRLHFASGTVAGDGTVIEVAASRYRSLRAEALMAAAREAKAAAEANPAEPQLARKADLAEQTATLVQERMRERRWRKPGNTELSPIEPGQCCSLARMGSLVHHTSRARWCTNRDSSLAITSVPAISSAAIEPMLDQHKAAFGRLPLTLLLHAGFASNSLLELLATAEVDVLCPTGRANGDDNWERRQRRDGGFSKQAFRYVAELDVYRCPTDRELVFSHWSADSHMDGVMRGIAELAARIVRYAGAVPLTEMDAPSGATSGKNSKNLWRKC